MKVEYAPLPTTRPADILLSVILVTNRGLGILLPAIACLREQTLAGRMELLVVAKSGAVTVDEAASVTGFAAVGLVSLGEVGRRGRAAAYAVPFATGRFLALQENHSFGAPDMYARLVEEFDDSTAAMSPNFRPANPGNLWGLCSYVLFHGSYAPPLRNMSFTTMPYHAAVYRREVLQPFHNLLPSLLEREDELHKALGEKGLRLQVSPDATIFHINESRWRRCCADPFIAGRLFGATRARNWSFARRMGYASLLPAICGLHVLRSMDRAHRLEATRDRFMRLIPRLLVVATAFGIGEVAGYLTQSERISEDFEEHEFHVASRLAGQPIQDARFQRLLQLLPADAP